MGSIDYELQYNSRRAVPEHAEIAARWDELAAQYRAEADAQPDIPYGPGERNRFDFFRGRGADGAEPVVVYIHGGYWRSRDRKTFSHLARGFNARGISVAVPSYDHCPHVSVMDIVGQMRACLAKVWAMTGQHPVVVGNSAGGHLAAAMLATDWAAVKDAPDDLVRAAYGLSGLYDLRPICEVSVNADLKLTPETAEEASPLFWDTLRPGTGYVAAVGELESSEFRRQSRTLVDVWATHGVATEFAEIPGVHHFSIVDALAAPDSPMAERVAAMAEEAAKG